MIDFRLVKPNGSANGSGNGSVDRLPNKQRSREAEEAIASPAYSGVSNGTVRGGISGDADVLMARSASRIICGACGQWTSTTSEAEPGVWVSSASHCGRCILAAAENGSAGATRQLLVGRELAAEGWTYDQRRGWSPPENYGAPETAQNGDDRWS